MPHTLSVERLLDIIKTQNEIAASALDLEAVLALVVQRAQALTAASAAVLEIAEGSDMVYRVACGTAAPHVGLRLPIATSLSGACVRTGELQICPDTSADPRVNAAACRQVGALSIICVPLQHDGETVGVLKVYSGRTHAFAPADTTVLDLLSGVMASHMTHAAEYQRRHRDSRSDFLTGLSNRRAFEERLGQELSRRHRHGGRFVLALVDLDRFKQINDTLGHTAGDSVLRAVARQLSSVRAEDTAFRLGGDEFALLLVGDDLSSAETVRRRVTALIRADPESRGVGTSWGIVTALDSDTMESLYNRADLALYADKAGLADEDDAAQAAA